MISGPFDSSAACTTAGYYCPAGTTSATQNCKEPFSQRALLRCVNEPAVRAQSTTLLWPCPVPILLIACPAGYYCLAGATSGTTNGTYSVGRRSALHPSAVLTCRRGLCACRVPQLATLGTIARRALARPRSTAARLGTTAWRAPHPALPTVRCLYSQRGLAVGTDSGICSLFRRASVSRWLLLP